MKTKYFSSTIICLLLLFSAHSQAYIPGQSLSHDGSMAGPAVTPRDLSPFGTIVNIHGDDGFYLKKNLYLYDAYTIIDGSRVMGTPFLYLTWVDGVLTTPDNRVYTDYKLKYDAYNQTVSFLNGKDSLEVNEEIKEFVLSVQIGDTTIKSRFINSSQFRSGKTAYYEQILDDAKGEVLKANTKKVTSNGDGLLSDKSAKYLNLESNYLYYDKTTKKLSKISVTGGNIQSILKLTEDQAKILGIDSYDFTNEGDIKKFFQGYFQQSQKGF